MPKKNDKDNFDKNSDIKTMIEELNNIVNKMENEDISFEENLNLYEKAVFLSEKIIKKFKLHQGKLEILNEKLQNIQEEIYD